MRILKFVLILLVFTSCSLEPVYEKPEVQAPLDEKVSKISEVSWEEFFVFDELKKIIKTTLENNRDLKIANLNIEITRGGYAISASNLLPTINADASYTKRGLPDFLKRFAAKRQHGVNISLASYEVDFFGRLRNLKKAALESYLASKEAKNITKISLISESANAYLNLLLDRELLDLFQQNYNLLEDKYKIVNLRFKNGIDNSEDDLNAKITLDSAKVALDNQKNIVIQDENILMNLMASYDRSLISSNKKISDVSLNEDLLEYIPSKSLLLRPDVKLAEHNLKAANADIGVARAAFYPSISLTGTFGYASSDLSSLFDQRSWNYVPSVNIPIFSAGRATANLKIAKLRKKVEVLNYETVVQNAFKEALDALSVRENKIENKKSFSKILKSQEKLLQIATLNKKHGIANEIALIDAKLNINLAKQNELVAKKEYITSLIMIYKILGGSSNEN